jgi:hypothetical protein
MEINVYNELIKEEHERRDTIRCYCMVVWLGLTMEDETEIQAAVVRALVPLKMKLV